MIRLDCKIHSHEGEITVTTENILPYLGIIEEKTIGIISKYLKLQEMRQPLSSGLKLIDADAGGKHAHSGLHINPPKLVDYSSDESGDDDDEQSSCLKPLHRENINHMRIQRPYIGAPFKRKTVISGRRGSFFSHSSLSHSANA